jgi:hypothetical protein
MVIVEACQVAPARIATKLDQAGPELHSEREPAKEQQDKRRRCDLIVAQEDAEESRLEEERLPPERIERLPHVDDRQVERPQHEPRCHRDRQRHDIAGSEEECG